MQLMFLTKMGASSSVRATSVTTEYVSKAQQKINKVLQELSKSDQTKALEILSKNPNFQREFEHFDIISELMSQKSPDIVKLTDLLLEAETMFFGTNEKKMHKNLGDYLAYKGFAEAAAKKYIDIIKKGPGNIENHKNTDLDEYHFLLGITSIFYNFSDSSIVLGERIAKTGIFKYLLKDLEVLSMEEEEKWKYSSVLESSLGCLHNCGMSCSAETRQCYRQENCVEKLVPFLKTKEIKIKVMVLLTLANIISEEENNLLLADAEVFNNLIGLVKSAQRKTSRRYDGFSVEEVLSGLKGLAKNDENKKIFVKKGILDVLKKVFNTKFDDGEVLEATETLRVLSFDKDNKTEIKKNAELMKIIQELSESKNERISKAASGIVWNLKEDKEKNKVNEKSTGGKGHVMISYQWADQKKLIQIQQSLKDNGYSIWIDINDMEGSTLEAMAAAVEKASVVLICMSEKYKESSNCRTEAEYAFTLKKPIIPLMMQRGYKPDGYLGMILGAKLFVDFSGKYAYEDSLNNLIKQLGENGRFEETAIDAVDGPIAAIKNVPLNAAKGNSTLQWSRTDVLNWLKKISLDKNTKLHNLSGEHLAFLKKISNRAPEFFFNYIKTDLELMQLDDMMKFSNGIDQL